MRVVSTSSIKMMMRTLGLDKYSWILANIFMTSFPLYTQTQQHTSPVTEYVEVGPLMTTRFGEVR